MSRVSVLMPTRGRPLNVERLLSSAYASATLPPEVIFYLDDDDPTLDQVVRTIERYSARYHIGSRPLLSDAWNTLARLATHDVLMQCGDDIVFRSHYWDERVTQQFDAHPDKLIVVHGRDGFQDANLATHGFYHRNWVETLGYLVPPYFSSDFNDLWNTEVIDALTDERRRIYLPDVFTEHMHPVAGKAELDQTHVERLERHQRDDVTGLYASLASRRAEDVAKLRAAVESRRFVAA